MAQVFRLQDNKRQTGLKNTISGWDNSIMYDDLQINAIPSSNPSSFHQPTSIPSPFARIALVKTAFAEVALHGNKALKAYQKVVSDSLDVGEIFFNLSKWGNTIKVIRWEYGKLPGGAGYTATSDLQKLKDGHRQLFKTLETFLEDDAEMYNFDLMDSIYLLQYTKTGDIIGATSPSTLFFSSGNELSNIKLQLPGNRNAFVGIMPLHQRQWEFVEYIYSWMFVNDQRRVVNGKSQSLFSEFLDYLETEKPKTEKVDQINALGAINADALILNYNRLSNPRAEILRKPLFETKGSASSLTIEDIFEDYIIRTSYGIAEENFFNGNIKKDSDRGFLLPIKDVFFKYYQTDDLKKNLTINSSGDIVDVILNIKGNNFKKRYSKSNNEIIDPLSFDCALFPNVKFSNGKQAMYRLGLACNFEEQAKFNVQYFIKKNNLLTALPVRLSARNKNHKEYRPLKNYSMEGSNFDFLKIHYGQHSGILIPEFKNGGGNKQFTFAVDLGTSNTNIEYKIDDGIHSQPFEIKKGEEQVSYLQGEEIYKTIFEEEFIPLYTDGEFNYPMRTAISFGENTAWNNVYPFEQASLNGLYEKRMDFDYNKTKTNLKWDNNPDNQNQLKCYIGSIAYLLRNKVVLNGGSLDKTKIVWFYPVSMDRTRLANLENIWNNTYKKFFGEDISNVIKMTESVAPYEFFVRGGNSNNLVTIDIGGGTTDIVISSEGQIKYITSFRFAANSVLGDGYSQNFMTKNGLIRQFADRIKTNLKNSDSVNKSGEVFRIFDLMEGNKTSDDFASFLFSLAENKEIISAGSNLAQNENLAHKLLIDETQTITFILFYAAIIFHLAEIMKAKELEMPDQIVFSGNGSRLIQFFSQDDEVITDYTKMIFEKVYGESYAKNDLQVMPNRENPKQVTCLGGLLTTKPIDFSEVVKKKIVMHSDQSERIIQNHTLNSDKDKYGAINNVYLEKTVEYVRCFLDLILEHTWDFFQKKGFALNNHSYEVAKKVCYEKLDIYVNEGWKQKKAAINQNDIIEETFFFYPIVGMIKALADTICDANLNAN